MLIVTLAALASLAGDDRPRFAGAAVEPMALAAVYGSPAPAASRRAADMMPWQQEVALQRAGGEQIDSWFAITGATYIGPPAARPDPALVAAIGRGAAGGTLALDLRYSIVNATRR